MSNASGHPGAQGDRSARVRAHARVARLLLLMAVVLSAAPVEAQVGPYARTLILRSIPLATALTSQTVTFPTLSRKAYGVAPFTVSATASSGLPVSFASLTPPVCTASGNTVTILAVGTCTIQASQAGNATFASAPNVNRNVTVFKASQTITFGALAAKVYGAAPFAVSATASSGLLVSFASTTTTICTVSASTVTIVAAGTCKIQASQAGNGNYSAATAVNQSFTVAKASQTITFGALAAKVYGAAPFAVSATASSGLLVSFASTTTTVCTVSGTIATIVAPGTCTLRATQAGNANYSAAPNVEQSFIVSPALISQTISFGALGSQTFGAAPFAISATASSGLSVSFAPLTAPMCTLSGNTVTVVAVGTCTIQASQAGNASYAAAPNVNQSFTIAKATQTISFGALGDRPLGSAPFSIGATASSGLAVSLASLTTPVCTLGGSTFTLVAAGTCTIQASQAGNGNYAAAANVNQSFSATSLLSQTISFGALANQTLGAAPLALTANATSGLPVSFASLTTTICTLTGSTVTLVAAGTCTIRASQAGNATYNAAPNVDQSFTVSAALISQTIVFSAPANQILGAAPFSLTATASSGLSVSFSSLTVPVCTVSGSTVTLVAAGTCTMRASQAGNATYAAAASVDQGFGVANPALLNQTISFGALADQILGAGPLPLTATASSGLPVSFSSLTVTVCTLSGSTVTLVAAGTCTVQASQAGNAIYVAAANVSQSFNVTLLTPQTISFAAMANQILGVAPFSVSATASSGLPVSFASLTTLVCTLSGATVTLIAIGTCTIQASQAGNATYAAAPNVSQSFNVTSLLPQTILFAVLANQVLGAAPFSVSATASSGLTVSFASLTTTICTVNSNTVTLVAAGTCTIRASQAGNATYSAAPNVDQSFTVNAAPISQTIAFGALANQVLGAAPFTLTATASSGLPVSFVSLTTAVCTLSGSTVTLVAVGTCTMRASQGGNATYAAAASIDQSFTVNPALISQTISLGALANQTLGVAPFALTASVTSGLPVSFSALTVSVCTVSGGTVTIVATGTCTIRASQAGNATYSAAPNVDQSFTVSAAPISQTITFGALANQILGAAPFTVSATATSGLPVAFSSLTTATCTVSGSSVTLVAVGTCTVRASQAGNATYAAAANVDPSFSVTQSSHAISFAASVAYAMGLVPTSIALGDINGDGIPDLAVANYYSTNVSILIGHADGTFTPGTTVTSTGSGVAVALADFNGDGKLDLAVCDRTSGNVVIFSGNGNGTFTRIGSFTSGISLSGMAFADLNRDGKLDLVITGTSGTTGTIAVLLGNGNGSFHAPVLYVTGTNPYAVTVADFNGDGKPDLAVSNRGSNTVSILMGNGDGTFAAAANYVTAYSPEGLAVGDFNGDGKLDLAVVNDSSNNVSIFLGRGDGTFDSATSFATVYRPASVAVADFNGDGWVDLAIVSRWDNALVLLLGNGDGTFQAPLTYNMSGQPGAVLARDLNGDGKPDLVVTGEASNNISVLLQTSPVPAALSIQSGSPQTAAIGTVYVTPLAVLVRDAGGYPVPGVALAFAAPATGASGTFSSGATVAQATSSASGVATAPTFTANATIGSFTVIASVAALNATFALTNSAASSGSAPVFTSGPPPNGTVNASYSFTVAAIGTPAPTFSTLSNSLPTGLALNGTSGLIAGTPSTQGTFAGMLTAANGVPPDATQTFAITIAGLAQTISFLPLGNRTLGAAPFAVSATASSGLPLVFVSLTPPVCVVSFVGLVAITTTGTCTIQASQAGNATYAPAPNVNQSFVVLPVSQTISFEVLANRNVSAPPFALSASASSGLAVSFSSSTAAVCTMSGNTVTLLAAGTCTIRAAQGGNASYSAAPNVEQSFQVTATSNQPPALTLILPTNNSVYVAPAIVPLYAIASDADGTISKVEFYDGAKLLSTATSAPYTFRWTAVGVGSYVITAKAYDNENAITVSAVATVTVNATGQHVSFIHSADFPIGSTPHKLVVGDFNGDARVDLLVTHGGYNVTSLFDVAMLRGDGAGNFTVAGEYFSGGTIGASDATFADFNGDGKLDLATSKESGFVAIQLGDGAGALSNAVVYPVRSGAYAILSGDFNGDGKLDLVTANGDGTISILFGNGDGTFQNAISLQVGSEDNSTIATGDVNGDGKLDLVMTKQSDLSLLILLGNGDGSFQPVRRIVPGVFPSRLHAVALGDFNGDGKLDIAITNLLNPNVSILLGNGDGSFQPAFDYPTGAANGVGIVVADFDSDGKLDLAVANGGENTISVLLGNGNGSFQAPSTIATGPGPTSIVAGDFNGDGKLDLAAANASDTTISVLINATGLATRAPAFTNGRLPDGEAGVRYDFTFTASGVPSPVLRLSDTAVTFFAELHPDGLLTTGAPGASGCPCPGLFSGTAIASNGVAPDASQAFTVLIRRKNQAITFDPLPDRTLGTSYIYATASSNLTVTFVSLTPDTCSITVGSPPTVVTLTAIRSGSCIIRAEQAGNGYAAPAPSVDRSFTVSSGGSVAYFNVVISAPADGANFVAPATITLNAIAHSSYAFSHIQQVDYYHDEGLLLGTATTPPYTIIWSNVGLGTHALTARATLINDLNGLNGGYAFSPPVTIVVTAVADQPVVALTDPLQNSLYVAPATIALAATATDYAASIAKIDFYSGATLLGSATSTPYTFTWDDVPPGTFVLTARATNAVGAATTSAPVIVSVDPGIPTAVASYNFDDAWPTSGYVHETLGGFEGIPQGSVTTVAAPAIAPKADTCQAVGFGGGTIDVHALPMATVTGAKTTAAFWMRWDGADGVTPLSWATQGLLFSAGSFGFTTLNNDVYGIAAASLASGWHHVVVEFTNGGVINNRLFIDGVLQSLTQRAGAPNNANAIVSSGLRIGGRSNASDLRFIGQLDELQLFQGMLSTAHVHELYVAPNPCAALKVTLAAPPNNAEYAAPATIELVAAPASLQTAIARVDFYSGATLLASSFAQPHAFAWSNVVPGPYTLSAKVTDTAGAVATSAGVLVTVVARAPEVTLTAPIADSIFSRLDTINMRATASEVGGSIAKVEFMVQGDVVGTKTQPPYEFVWTAPYAAFGTSYDLTARATDARGASTTTSRTRVFVVTDQIAINLTAPANNALFVSPTTVVLSANAIPTQAGDTIAKVEFYTQVGAVSQLIGTATTPPYSTTWANFGAGTYNLYANATGTLGTGGQSQIVRVNVSGDRAPIVALTSPAAGAQYSAPATITFAATASDPDGTVAKVEFFAGTTLVETVTAAPYSATWNNVVAGSYVLTAKATDTLEVSAISSPINVTVAANASPSINLTAPPSGAQYAQGQPIVLTASAATPAKTIDRVEFYADATLLRTVTVPGSVATATVTFTWNGAGLGAHVLSAKVFATDGTNATSPTVNITVGDLAVVLTEPYAGQVYQAPGDIRISANLTETSGTIVQIDFYGDGVLLGSATAAPYSFLWSGVSAGARTVSATARDSGGFSASSGPITISVVSTPILDIDAGIDGASISDDNTMLSGTAQAPSNSAVVVNGQSAALDQSGRFFVNNVQLVPGSNTVTFVLNTLDGAPITRTVTLNSTGIAPFTVALDKQEGLAPFTPKLTITNRGNVPFQRIELDLNDDGTPEQTLTSLTNGSTVQTLTYNNAGTYTLRVTVYDASNTIIYLARRKIRIYLPVELGLKVVNVYKSMVNRLIANNPTSALRCFTGDSRANYAEVFGVLGTSLPTVASQLGTLVDGVVSEDSTELTIVRDTPAGAETFMIHMIRGGDGIWRIESM